MTACGMQLINCTLRQCWEECLRKSEYEKRKIIVNEFNRVNRWKKRGISVIPTKYGIGFNSFVTGEQAGALVHIYSDGFVSLCHGGTEMGQGLHTKMIQVASRALGVPISKIYTVEAGTNTVPNTSATAASSSSDLNGMAILNACNTLNKRLEPIKLKYPKATWEEWAHQAWFERISLSATGFYKTPGLREDPETETGNPFNYYSYGAACSEVEIDCLTGDHKVIRTDIIFDVGRSLNPAIDIGQIEGAFAQGYGLFTLEEHKYSPNGFLFTRGPGAYKIPSIGDVPTELNVMLLKGASNPKAVYSSKAIGEPPLNLASSVFFAIKDAIIAARSETGASPLFRLDSPASAERIRMACEDEITKKVPTAEGNYTPWSITV